MKTGWQRETRVCAPIGLRGDLLDAMRAHLERLELREAEAQALICWETTSRRVNRPTLTERLAGASFSTVTQAVLVTPTRLIWAITTNDDEAQATSELLAKLDVTDYESSPAYGLMPDHGVEVAGVRAMGGNIGTLFFGLGDGPDADRARAVLKAAAKAAHGEGPPPTSP